MVEWRNNNKMAFFEQECFCIITGASRGLGRSIAQLFAKEWGRRETRVNLILLARSRRGLEETRQLVEKESSSVRVHIVEADLSDPVTFDNVGGQIRALVVEQKPPPSAQAVLVHNAGSLGDVTKWGSDVSALEASAYMNLNFATFVGLTSCFLSQFEGRQRFIINISSILGSVPFPAFGLYGAGKAARDQFLRVLCKEDPKLRVLSYSPGPCDTDMQECLRTSVVNEEARKNAQESYAKGQVLKPDQSISKLIQLLEEDTYKNAEVVDYFDDGKPQGV